MSANSIRQSSQENGSSNASPKPKIQALMYAQYLEICARHKSNQEHDPKQKDLCQRDVAPTLRQPNTTHKQTGFTYSESQAILTQSHTHQSAPPPTLNHPSPHSTPFMNQIIWRDGATYYNIPPFHSGLND